MADAYTGGSNLDQSAITDAINRKYKGYSQKQRNQMMQAGTTNPDSFALQNQDQIQQAQQPSEFWGAGRKELTPDIDTSLVSALGGSTTTLGGDQYYYSPYDISKAKWGTMDSDDTDLGNGKYNIMVDGQSLGTGYKSLADTIKDYQRAQYTPKATTSWQNISNRPALDSNGSYDTSQYRISPDYSPSISSYGGDAAGVTYDNSNPIYQQLMNGYTANGSDFYNDLASAKAGQEQLAAQHITGNTTRDWETLGQLLTYGGVTGDFTTPHALGGNNATESITGLNTLFGSKPIIYDGKLLGYNQQGQVDPIQNNWNIQNTSTKKGILKDTKTNTWDVGNVGVGRQYNDSNWWANNVTNPGDGTYTITPEAAANSPGWNNLDYFNRQAGSNSQSTYGSNRIFGNDFHTKVGQVLDPILNFFTPTFGGTARVGRATDALMNGGSFGDSYKAATADGWQGAGRSLALQAISDWIGGAYGNSSSLGSGIGEASGFTGSTASAVDKAITASAQAAANAAVNGGSSGDIAKASASGGLGNLIGAGISENTKNLGDVVSKMSGGAASGAVNSLFNKNSPINGAGYGALSGGLWGYLNSTNNASDAFSNEKSNQNKSTANAITSLAKLIANRKK